MRKWQIFWQRFDQARIFPRICVVGYAWMAYSLHQWFIMQKDISTPQTIYISTVWAAMPILLKWYMENGVDWTKNKEP